MFCYLFTAAVFHQQQIQKFGDGESSDYKDISGHSSDYFGQTVLH